MSNDIEAAVAAELRNAYSAGPLPPVAPRLGLGNVAAAYRVQELNSRVWLAEGRRLVGRKIGLTAPVVQRQLGVDEPDCGLLFEDMLLADGAGFDAGTLIAGRIEAEVAVGLQADLDDPNLDEADLVRAIGWLAPALEIVDSRIADWKISIVDTIADNASSAYFVLGERRVRPDAVDVVGATMRLRRDNEIVSEGVGAACLGSPYTACVWLARKMCEVGRPLRAGEIIMSGALGPMAPLQAGAAYEAEIDGLGSVSVRV